MARETSEIYAEMDRRMREAVRTMHAVLDAEFAASLSLPIEEQYRLHVQALGNLLDGEAKPWPR